MPILRSLWIPLLIAATSASSARAQKIHALIVVDVSPAAQWGVFQANLDNDSMRMHMLLEENSPEDRVFIDHFYIDADELADPAEVLAAIDRFRPAAEDTILLYYTGHGGLDDRGSYFDLARGKLYRADVLRMLREKGARLAVLLSDCCNSRNDGKYISMPRAAPPHIPQEFTPLFQSLFVDPQGVVDVNACAPGQSAFFAPHTRGDGDLPGSLFTMALEQWMKENRDRRSSWDELLSDVGVRTHLAFRAAYPDGIAFAKGAAVQRDQNVYARDYPGKPSDRGPRAGIAVRDDDDGLGAVITEVVPGSPAERAYDIEAETYGPITKGSRITVMNGRPISSASEFEAAIAASPQILRMTVETPDMGTKIILVRLRY